jgi:hypothetical protein
MSGLAYRRRGLARRSPAPTIACAALPFLLRVLARPAPPFARALAATLVARELEAGLAPPPPADALLWIAFAA